MEHLMRQNPAKKCGFQGKLALDKGFSDALRDYARSRWPVGTAKMAAREFDLTLTEGRGVADGTASKTTVEKCIKRGGALLGLVLLADVRGQGLADIIDELNRGHNETSEEIGDVFGHVVFGRSHSSFAAPGGAAELYRRGGRRAG